MTTFKIHPAIGIARLGNSDEFYLTPEQPGALPIACDTDGVEQRDAHGQPVRVQRFKQADDLGKVLRAGARFRVFAYDDVNPEGRELVVGDEFEFEVETSTTGRFLTKGKITDIAWTVHIANKKASWYTFAELDGRHGYSPTHPLRNAEVTDPGQRARLIIDPGPQTVRYVGNRRAEFTLGKNPGYPQNFPPPDISPNPIDTLGELIVNEQDGHLRLIVLGGRGNSGSTKPPIITSFVNNDGWFDDVGDGPVSAVVAFEYPWTYTDEHGKPVTETRTATRTVDVNAWIVVGYPRYAPQLLDMITMDEALYDLFVRELAYAPQLFGVPPFTAASNRPSSETDWRVWRNDADYNPDYYPRFYAEIWPILQRPQNFMWVLDFDYFGGGDPHNTGTGGNLDKLRLGTSPQRKPNGECSDPYRPYREYIYAILRKPGGENLRDIAVQPGIAHATNHGGGETPRAMPELCGSNPITNTAADKFLRLTDTQLFLLRQWAQGRFINEALEWGASDPNVEHPWAEPPTTGEGIDRGVLGNALGGAFCPGGELSWIILNPAIWAAPYRIKHAGYIAGALSLPDQASLADGMQPGDLTKYTGVPWQADFHECSTQDIDVTYEDWNVIQPGSTGDPVQTSTAYSIPWWPAHRPMVVANSSSSPQVYWASGLPDNNAGDLQMVTHWKDLGFLFGVDPFGSSADSGLFQVERNDAAVGPSVRPGSATLGAPTP